jgi:hypothetical protein
VKVSITASALRALWEAANASRASRHALSAGMERGAWHHQVFYGMKKRLDSQEPAGSLGLRPLVISGMVSGTVLSFILSPTELLKVRHPAAKP